MKYGRPFSLHLIKENGYENHTYQSKASDFEVSVRDSRDHWWRRLYKPIPEGYWARFSHQSLFGDFETSVNPFTLSGGLQVTEVNRRTRSVTVSEPQVRSRFSEPTSLSGAMEQLERTREEARAQALAETATNEATRRFQQSQADRARREEERTRERRPWDRARNFFGI